jgi:hypothetical protein
MVDQTREILCIIVKIHSVTEIKGVLPTALLYEIAKFTEYVKIHPHILETIEGRSYNRTLQKVLTVLRAQQGMGKIRQLFKQASNSSSLENCNVQLGHSLDRFKVERYT